jgi:hypothetical protein
MISRDSLKQKLDICPDESLQQVADFLEFLAFRHEKTIDLDPLADDTPKSEMLSDFRQAWHEAMTGQGIPVRQLWAELEAQDSLDDTIDPRSSLQTLHSQF